MSSIHSISVDELREHLARHTQRTNLIDVRTPAEYRQAHVPSAELQPLDQLDVARLKTHYEPSAEHPLHVICKSGARAMRACQQLSDAGVEYVRCVEGGTDAWLAAGYEAIRGDAAVISLERQVRIGAGFLVAVGVALGWFASPWFLILPAFVGCGLMFAGITGWCGMGLMLARLPWNR